MYIKAAQGLKGSVHFFPRLHKELPYLCSISGLTEDFVFLSFSYTSKQIVLLGTHLNESERWELMVNFSIVPYGTKSLILSGLEFAHLGLERWRMVSVTF